MSENLTAAEEDQFQAAIDKYSHHFWEKAVKNAKQHTRKNRDKALDYVETFDYVEQIRYAKKRTPHWFVTLNPKPGISIETLHNTIIDVLSHPDIRNPLWAYEVRRIADEGDDNGLHAHLYFECDNITDNFCKRKVKAPFVPNICGTMKHVHIKWVSSEEIDAVKSYIRKTTTTKSKKLSDNATKLWRLENDIPSELGEDHLLVWSDLTTQEPAFLELADASYSSSDDVSLLDNIL